MDAESIRRLIAEELTKATTQLEEKFSELHVSRSTSPSWETLSEIGLSSVHNLPTSNSPVVGNNAYSSSSPVHLHQFLPPPPAQEQQI